MRTAGLCLAVISGLSLAPSAATAAPVWTGDFESADLSQFGFLLNPTIDRVDYITLEEGEVAQGSYAARVELHNDAEWGNGLKRVELQHRPEDARTSEGATTFFAWSVFLPDDLPADPSQQIGYWESTGSFQQMMAFEAVGTTLRFHTRRPQNVTQWEGEGALTAGEWHRIAMSVTWSTSADQGRVSLWFDGEAVVTDAGAQTLADNNPHFVQIGLLRGAFEFEDVPTIIIDHALEGDSLRDVEFDALPGASGESTGGDSSGGVSTGGETTGGPDSGDSDDTDTTASTSGGGSSTSGGDSPTTGLGSSTSSTSAVGSETDTDGVDASGEGGCVAGGRQKSGAILLFLALVGLIGRRRA